MIKVEIRDKYAVETTGNIKNMRINFSLKLCEGDYDAHTILLMLPLPLLLRLIKGSLLLF